MIVVILSKEIAKPKFGQFPFCFRGELYSFESQLYGQKWVLLVLFRPLDPEEEDELEDEDDEDEE